MLVHSERVRDDTTPTCRWEWTREKANQQRELNQRGRSRCYGWGCEERVSGERSRTLVGTTSMTGIN